MILASRSKKPWYHKHLKVWQLYAFALIPVLCMIVFLYIPMIGNVVAFQEYSIRRGFSGSTFVGLKYFKQFFNTPIFGTILKNTILISIYSLAVSFPFPILLALAFNEIKNQRLKKALQTITYAPYFISTVVMISIVMQVFSYRYGVINSVIRLLGGSSVDFLGNSSYFRSIYVWSGVWQGAGYSAVLYIAALSGIDVAQYEAAIIDGANRLQRVIHIDIPGILPTIIIMLILSTGGILSVGFEKVFLLQNPANYSVSEIISTYVYKIGVEQAQFSLSTAIGLFNAIINFSLLFIVNFIARRVGETSLF